MQCVQSKFRAKVVKTRAGGRSARLVSLYTSQPTVVERGLGSSSPRLAGDCAGRQVECSYSSGAAAGDRVRRGYFRPSRRSLPLKYATGHEWRDENGLSLK